MILGYFLNGLIKAFENIFVVLRVLIGCTPVTLNLFFQLFNAKRHLLLFSFHGLNALLVISSVLYKYAIVAVRFESVDRSHIPILHFSHLATCIETNGIQHNDTPIT